MNILKQTEGAPEIPVYSSDGGSYRKRTYTITNYYTFADDAQLAISPNPASTEANVQYRFIQLAVKPLLTVCDMTGKIMREEIINPNESFKTISTVSLLPGMYYIQLRDGDALLKSLPLVIIK